MDIRDTSQLKPYTLQFWGYDPEHIGQTQLLSRDVLVSEDTVAAMTSKKVPKYLRFVVKDGQALVIREDCVMSLWEQI
ncbi:hypothetical protein LOSG293_110410 [Secundilactobacillus oryzae JCM 18671]|uniref:Uncharacterized protein n=1 Tax=Secundilactobacillus oryzae JCM 18671 TaxID=1291743 RepID=A0A081BI57_9LACO|nr:hypothetical protein [Secundilactobacillus oryzae]GAK47725.1 hypothetical protein LOSG293_110410 [Secundilactobacillus oryzae JCM 18671]